MPWAVVSTSTIQLFDQTIKVHHLNDGRRVIDAEDVEKFWKFLVVAAGAIDRDELKKAMEGLK